MPFFPSFPDPSALALIIIYNCELPARLVLITSHGYDLYIRTLITNYLTYSARCQRKRRGVIGLPVKSSDSNRTRERIDGYAAVH